MIDDRSIQHTVLYTELASTRFKNFLPSPNEKPQPDGAGAKLAILFVRIGRYSPASSGRMLSGSQRKKDAPCSSVRLRQIWLLNHLCSLRD